MSAVSARNFGGGFSPLNPNGQAVGTSVVRDYAAIWQHALREDRCALIPILIELTDKELLSLLDAARVLADECEECLEGGYLRPMTAEPSLSLVPPTRDRGD